MAGLVGSFASEEGEFGDFTEADCVMMNYTVISQSLELNRLSFAL